MFGIENIIFSVFTVLAGALLVISLLAFQRSKKTKMLMLSAVFLIFVVKGLVISISLFVDLLSPYWLVVAFGIFDCIAIVVLYFSTLKV